MTTMTKPVRVLPRQIVRVEAFEVPGRGIDKGHVKALVRLLKNKGRLNPVLLWKERCKDGLETGRLVLLDGAHRLDAYRQGHPRSHSKGIPAVVFEGTYGEARVKALDSNGLEKRSMTASQRADATWRLVVDPEVTASKEKIASVTGVSERTVANMRSRWREMQEEGREATGWWWRDRLAKDPMGKPDMTNKQRDALIEEVAKKLQQATSAIGMKQHDLLGEALERAFGSNLRVAAEYVFGKHDEFADPGDENLGADDEEAPERDF